MAEGGRKARPFDDDVIFSLVTRHSVQFPLGLPFRLPKSLRPHFTFCQIILLKTSKNIGWSDEMSRSEKHHSLGCAVESQRRSCYPTLPWQQNFSISTHRGPVNMVEKKTKKLTCMTFLCMVEVRKKTAYTFLHRSTMQMTVLIKNDY